MRPRILLRSTVRNRVFPLRLTRLEEERLKGIAQQLKVSVASLIRAGYLQQDEGGKIEDLLQI